MNRLSDLSDTLNRLPPKQKNTNIQTWGREGLDCLGSRTDRHWPKCTIRPPQRLIFPVHMPYCPHVYLAARISIDTDNNHAVTLLGAWPVFQIAEHFFCFYFSFEWFCRFMSFRKKRDGCKDGWFVFDSGMVSGHGKSLLPH